MADAQPQTWPAFEYYFALHDFTTAERSAKADAEIKRRAAQGWRVHSFQHEGGVYLGVMWHRPAQHGSDLDKAHARVSELEAELARVPPSVISSATGSRTHDRSRPDSTRS